MDKMLMQSSPHIRGKLTTRHIMLDVLIALLPVTVVGCVYFGLKAVVTLLLSCFSAVVTEVVWLLIKKKPIKEILLQFDFTSLVTGLLLGLSLPALEYKHFYIPVLGSVFAIAVVKMLFGGTGKNIVNPAVCGRVFCFISFTVEMNTYPTPWVGLVGGLYPSILDADGITTGATVFSNSLANGTSNITYLDMFLGSGIAGCIGETCKLALLVGGIYLVVRKVISWQWPVIYMTVTSLLSCALYRSMNMFVPSLLGGGLMLGAIFMATDYVTSPANKPARYVYYVLLGVVTALLRKGTKMETVSFSILLMNLLVPLLDLYIRPIPFGADSKIKIWVRKIKQKVSQSKEGGTK